MTINYIKGDLFTSKDLLIAHGCNDCGVMGSGVAKTIKERFPAAYEGYKNGDHHLLGHNIYVNCDGVVIANCITQKGYGFAGDKRFVSYDAVDSCMSRLCNYCIRYGIKSISIPKIGAGLGGGDWAIIEKIIERAFKDVTVNIYVLD